MAEPKRALSVAEYGIRNFLLGVLSETRMHPPGKARNRFAFALLVGGLHVLVVWPARNWSPNQPRQAPDDEFAFTVFFDMPKAQSPADQISKPQKRSKIPSNVDHLRISRPPPSPSFDESTAITLPRSPPAADWAQDLGDAADDAIEKARQDARRADRFEDRHEAMHEPKRDYDWYVRHSRQVIDAHGVPVWVLTQPCAVLILKTDPNCTVEHVEEHGVMFEYMQQEHDARLKYGGSNAVP